MDLSHKTQCYKLVSTVKAVGRLCMNSWYEYTAWQAVGNRMSFRLAQD